MLLVLCTATKAQIWVFTNPPNLGFYAYPRLVCLLLIFKTVYIKSQRNSKHLRAVKTEFNGIFQNMLIAILHIYKVMHSCVMF